MSEKLPTDADWKSLSTYREITPQFAEKYWEYIQWDDIPMEILWKMPIDLLKKVSIFTELDGDVMEESDIINARMPTELLPYCSDLCTVEIDWHTVEPNMLISRGYDYYTVLVEMYKVGRFVNKSIVQLMMENSLCCRSFIKHRYPSYLIP